MSAWADYFREKGFVVLETDRGFISAMFQGAVCVVDNFYVKPEYRGTSSAFQLALQLIHIAKQRGCTDFAAEAYKSDSQYADNVELFKHFGMTQTADDEFKTTLSKRINDARPESAAS